MTGHVFDHLFVNFKSEEMICWPCGFVIWRCDSDKEIAKAVRDLDGGTCPKKWHGQHGQLPTPSRRLSGVTPTSISLKEI